MENLWFLFEKFLNRFGVMGPILLLLYAPHIFRGVFFFLNDNVFGLRSLNRWVGRLEIYFGWMRDYAAFFFGLIVFGARLKGHFLNHPPLPMGTPFELLFLFLSVASRFWRRLGLYPLQEFVRRNPRSQPEVFWDHFFRRFGFLPHRVPHRASKQIDPAHIDFRDKKKAVLKRRTVPLIAYQTFLMIGIAKQAFKRKGPQYLQQVGSGIALIWAVNIARICSMEVKVEKSSFATSLPRGKKIYAITHKSFLDFCVAPLAFYQENPDGSAASFMPSIMIAKDHFKDNVFLYRILGLGQLCEAWGMVFVDRKSKKNRKLKAKQAIDSSVKSLLTGQDNSFAIYPQGHRARGQFFRDGSRWDAGYFCVKDTKRVREGIYFRKGLGYIAVDCAINLLKLQLAGPVSILPVAMQEIGTACPLGSLKVQTNCSVKIKMGAPIIVKPEEFLALRELPFHAIAKAPEYLNRVDSVTREVNLALQNLLEIRSRLERRFYIDLNDITVDKMAVEEMAVALKEWRDEGELVYMILDCVYALPVQEWHNYLRDLANVLRHNGSKNDLVDLRNRVCDSF